MDIASVQAALKELTLDMVNGKRNRQETVEELYKRVQPDEIYKLDESVPERDFIIDVTVSLEHLTEEGFAPSMAEIRYFAECFEGKRVFSREEVRRFPIGAYEKQQPRKKREEGENSQ